MSAQRFPQPNARPMVQASTSDEAAQLAHVLYRALLTATPKRAACMTAEGDVKYRDVKGHNLTTDDLCDHLAGRRTWATTLADGAGLAVAGCRDYDQGGEAVIVAALDAARSASLVAFGIVLEGAEGEHSGGHVWAFYRNAAPASDIRAQLATLPGAKGECYPSGNAVRLPLGFHRRKHTRGALLLQDGRRFDLDRPEELVAGLRVILTLKRNAAPPSAPAGASRTSASSSFGEHYKAADFEGLPDGAALMASPRYQALFRFRPQLATLARGERVALKREGALDDSGSAQVAALICNLLTTCRKGQAPGVGAPPLDEIRAVALHFKPALRDNRELDHYKAHIAYEIARYTPPDYAPEATAYIPDQRADAPRALAAARYGGAGRPAGQRSEQAARLLAIVEALPADGKGWRETTRAQLGAVLGCGERMVSEYLKDLRGDTLETEPRPRGVALRVAINSPAEPCNRSSADRSTTPENAPSVCMETHSARGGLPAPLVTPLPAPVAAPIPASNDGAVKAEPLGAHPTSERAAGGAGVPPEAEPLSPALQDIDISRISGSATEQRMAAVYRAQGEQVRIIPRDEQQREKRGDLERTLPDGRVIFSEIKGEKQYPGRCAAIEFETVPLNRVAYGGASGPAESRADTFTYMNTSTGAWWELEIATVRALLPQWQQQYRIIDGKVNERITPYGHARYHTRCVLVPQDELARHAIASGVTPDVLAEAVRVAYDAIAGAEVVNPKTGEIRRQQARIGRVLAELERQGHTFAEADVQAALAAEREARQRAELVASIADLPLNGLRAKVRQADRCIERSKDAGTGEWRFWWLVRAQCQERMRTLPPESEGQKAQRRRGGEVKPSPRKAGEAQQAELWDVANEALDEMRAERAPAQRPVEAPNKAQECSDATPALIALHNGADESTGAQPLNATATATLDVNGTERPNTSGWRAIANLFALKAQREGMSSSA